LPILEPEARDRLVGLPVERLMFDGLGAPSRSGFPDPVEDFPDERI
jgi:hypothetical protein